MTSIGLNKFELNENVCLSDLFIQINPINKHVEICHTSKYAIGYIKRCYGTIKDAPSELRQFLTESITNAVNASDIIERTKYIIDYVLAIGDSAIIQAYMNQRNVHSIPQRFMNTLREFTYDDIDLSIVHYNIDDVKDDPYNIISDEYKAEYNRDVKAFIKEIKKRKHH